MRRLLLDQPTKEKPKSETPMGEWLVEKLKKRKISTTEFVSGCKAEHASSSSSSQASRVVAQVSRLKPTSSNHARDVKNILEKDVQLLEAYEADIPLWDRFESKQVIEPMLFMNIHEVMDYVVKSNPDVEFCKFDADRTKAEDSMKSTCDSLGCDRETTAALSIWGDYAKYHTRDSIALMLWSFLSGPIRTRFWVCGFAKRQGCGCGCGQRCTLDAIFMVIGWMLRVLLSGVWPAVRHDGVPFAESTRVGDAARARLAGQPLALKGVIQKKCADWSWYKGALGLTGWSTGNGNQKTCFKCQANCNDVPWTDPGMSAAWRKTTITTKTFWSWVFFAGLSASPIFGWPGFTYAMLDVDWMHTVDLGVTLVVLGNMFLDFFYFLGGSHNNAKPTLGKILNMVKLASKSMGVSVPIWDLTMGMISAKASHWPVLKLKAGEARYMLPVCFHMASNFFPTASAYELLRLNMLQHLKKCYELLDAFDADAMGFHGRAFHMLYNQLNRGALVSDPRSVRWRLYPKFHLMIHLCESGENPRDSWNYADESEIGVGATVAEDCHPNTMHRSLIKNYRVFEFRKPFQTAGASKKPE
jgi:hypothetical protein